MSPGRSQRSVHELSPLFEDVQLARIFPDGKTFPDCIPLGNPIDILNNYNTQKSTPGFDLNQFVKSHFKVPEEIKSGYHSEQGKPIHDHIRELWTVLTRRSGSEEGSSLIQLPNAYVVPGGRFREIYYWDSYFTMLGLKGCDRQDLIRDMLGNFAFLIDQFGYIPNGNRTYFLGRSQPPFFSLMVNLLPEKEQLTFLPHLEKEYQFWMQGSKDQQPASHRVVRLSADEVLNRYWDENDTPRPEAYLEDMELSHHSKHPPAVLFRHIRAAAESGWDFSTRWFKDENLFGSIHTTDIIPVDLNALIYHLEKTLSALNGLKGNAKSASDYEQLASVRLAALQKYCWNEKEGFFFDYDFVEQKQKSFLTLAGTFPLFFRMATIDQAKACQEVIKSNFLKPGGLTTTLINSGQQWDAPNGWAPLQWIAFKGFKNYSLMKLAQDIAWRWSLTNRAVYEQTGKMTEKYDVWNDSAEASGGEYPNQDGFGWTNGVYCAMGEKSFDTRWN